MRKSIACSSSPALVAPIVRRQLLRWFDRNARQLPWRADRDPYRIWVSEVMLQQTQVATVIPYFQRFLAAFPTLADLAHAELEDVLRLWEGLGYYRRARDIHESARRMVDAHGSGWPRNPADWQDLPGIGRYMLGAVLSQAFDLRLPIVEANSQRVLCRLFGQRTDPRQGPVRQWLWKVASELLPPRRPGDFNQALMELGALVCTARPQCGKCPLADICLARRLGQEEAIPPPARPPQVVQVREAAVVVRRGKEVLLVRRPPQGRWANLWEFPHAAAAPRETLAAAARRVLAELTGVRAALDKPFLTLQHSVTRHRISLTCFEARYRSGSFASSFYAAGKWLEPSQLQCHPVSAPQRRLARSLFKEE